MAAGAAEPVQEGGPDGDRGWTSAAVRVALFVAFGALFGPAAPVFGLVAESLALLVLWLAVGDRHASLRSRLFGFAVLGPLGLVCLGFAYGLALGGDASAEAVLRMTVGMALPLLSGVAGACAATLREGAVPVVGHPAMRVLLLAMALFFGAFLGFSGGSHRPEEGLWLVGGLVTAVGAGFDTGFITIGAGLGSGGAPPDD